MYIYIYAYIQPVYSPNIRRIVILLTLPNCTLNASASKSTAVQRLVNFSSQKTSRAFFGTVFTPVFKPFVGMRRVIYRWKAMD